MTHSRVLQCLSVNGNYLKLPFSGVFVCVCMGKLVQQEQGWCQSGNNGGNCPLCRGGILGNNGGIALVVGWLVVGTQLVLPSWYPVQWVLPLPICYKTLSFSNMEM